MRPKTVVAIVAIAVISLLGFVRGVFLVERFIHDRTPAGRTLIACQGKDEETALRGCSEAIDSGGIGYGSAKAKNLVYAYNRRSLILIHRKQFDRAIEDSGQAIRVDPGANIAYVNRANAYVNEKNDASALRDFDQAIRLNPSDGFAYTFRDLARSATGDLAGGLDDCNRGIGLRPKDDFAFECRGFAYLRMKQFSRALPDYNTALQGHPHVAGWLYCRGAVKRGLGDKAGFDSDRAAALQVDPAIAHRYARFGID